MKWNAIIRKIKNEIEPNPEFMEKARGRFLAMYDAQYPRAARVAMPLWRTFAMRMAGVVAMFAVILTATSAYADQQDVSAASPLYPLKRLSESIRLATTADANKQEVYTQLAQRRVQELEQGGTISAASKNQIASDANAELKRSLQSISPKTSSGLAPLSSGVPVHEKESPAPTPTPKKPVPTTTPTQSAGHQEPIPGLLPPVRQSPGPTPSSPKAATSPRPEIKSGSDGHGENGKVRDISQCKTLERAINNSAVWSQVGDQELEDMFKDKCSE